MLNAFASLLKMLEKMLAYCTKAYTADMLIIIEIPGNKGNFHFLNKFRLIWFVNVVYMGTSGERDMKIHSCGCDHFSRVNS